MPNSDGTQTYNEILTAAMADISEHGYDSFERVQMWTERLTQAARREMKSDAEVDAIVREAMTNVFRKQVTDGGVLKRNPGVKAYTVEQIKPELRRELDRRIAASVDLIKLNREQSILKTRQRFSGWATSVPIGGDDVTNVKKAEEKKLIRKALTSLKFDERRVAIDQSAKLFNAINDITATNGGAIGAEWHSHHYSPESRARPVHAARNGRFFLLRGSWADLAGYVKPNKDGYTDDVEQPGEPVFCSCGWVWKFSLRSIPPECLTQIGKDALAEARAKIAAM